MGKKKYKNNYDKMDYHEKQGFLLNQADKYGVNMDDYSEFGDVSGARGMETKSYKDLEEHVVKLSQNDYSNRRAIEAATMAGNKNATQIGGMNEGMNQLAATEKWMEKMHGKHVGGGDYTYGSDPAAVAQHYVERDREKQNAQFVTNDEFNDYKKNLEANSDVEAKKEVVLSEHMQKAKDRVDDWEGGNPPLPIFNEGIRSQAEGNAASQLSKDIDIANLTDPAYFLENKKRQVIEGENLQPVF